jgi:hypothetical protein
VFPPDQYGLHFSERYIDDLVTGKATHADPEQRSDRIYTGFAVRRGVFDAVSERDLLSLGVIHAADGRPVRWGTEILLEKDGQLLRLLSVHLKSGCYSGSLENLTDPDRPRQPRLRRERICTFRLRLLARCGQLRAARSGQGRHCPDAVLHGRPLRRRRRRARSRASG